MNEADDDSIDEIDYILKDMIENQLSNTIWKEIL